jgi:hypothetical protein
MSIDLRASELNPEWKEATGRNPHRPKEEVRKRNCFDEN